MKTLKFFIALMLLSACPLNAQDEIRLDNVPGKTVPLINDVQQTRVAMHPATRYVESSSFLLLDLDLDKIDVLKIASWYSELAPKDAPKSNHSVGMAAGILESMRAAGVKHVYAIFSTQSLADLAPIMVVPCEKPEAVEAILGLIKGGFPKSANLTFARGDNYLALAPLRAIKRFKKADRPERADLISPLFHPGRKDHMAVVSIPEAVRAELAAHWPDQFPDPDLKISPKELIQDISSATITWDLPPSPQLSSLLVCTSNEAAERTAAAAKEFAAWIPGGKDNVDVEQDRRIVKVEVDQAGMTAIARESTKVQQLKIPAVRHNLKEIGVAMHNYHSKHKHFPPRIFTDKEGTPLLSGRVAMLPFIEQLELYRSINLGKKWDAPENANHSATVIPTYSAARAHGKHVTTRMRFPVIEGSFWHGDGPARNIRSITDGTSNTIAIVFAPETAAVPWMSPESWILDEDKLVEQVFGDRDICPTLYFDGSMHVLSKKDMTNEKLKALLTIAGKERIEN